MKKWIGLFIILASIAAGVPYWTGVEVEKHFGYFHQTLLPSNQWKLTSYEFERGWLNSQAQASFFYSLFAADDYQVKLQHHISHGWQPLHTSTIDTQVSLAALQGANIGQFSPLADLHTQVQVTGENSSTLTLFPFSAQDLNQQISWTQAQAKIETTPTLSPMKARLELPALTWQHAQQKITLQQLQIDSELPSGLHDLGLGTTRVKLAKSAIQLNGLLPSMLSQFEAVIHNQVQEQFLNSDWQLYSAQLDVGNLQLTAAKLGITLQHWHAHSARNLKAALLDIRTLSAVQRNLGLIGALMQYGVPLLDNAPEVFINHLELHHGAEELQLTAHAKMNKVNMQALFDPHLLLQDLVAEMGLQVDKTLFIALIEQYFVYYQLPKPHELAQNKVNTLITQQWLLFEPKTEKLNLQLSFKNNVLQVNGVSRNMDGIFN
ncbi:MAG: hypothetical protein RL368_2511 [Pseudomonadota bacterium]|jgi:uncharacterized protein YdgA (DUF945 family)